MVGAVLSREEFGGDPPAMFDLHFATLEGEAVEDDLAVGQVHDVFRIVIDEIEGLFEQDLGLGLPGHDVHLLEVGMFARPTEDGGDAGHVGRLANLHERLRGGWRCARR